MIVIRAANTRYIKLFRFSPAKLLLGFNPQFKKKDNEFEDILKLRVVEDIILVLIFKEGIIFEKVNLEYRLAKINKIRERTLD